MNSMLPPSSTPLMRAIEAVIANRYAAIPVPHEVMQNPHKCPAQFLPWLAWEKRVPFWNEDWPEERKRTAIASSYDLNSLRGFVPGVLLGLEVIGLSGARHIEWHEEVPEATPGTFRIELPAQENIGGVVLDTARQSEILTVIDRMKRRSQHFTINIHSENGSEMTLAAAMSSFSKVSAVMADEKHGTKSGGLLTASNAIGRVLQIDMRAD